MVLVDFHNFSLHRTVQEDHPFVNISVSFDQLHTLTRMGYSEFIFCKTVLVLTGRFLDGRGIRK